MLIRWFSKRRSQFTLQETDLQRARRLRDNGDSWSAFGILSEEYEKNPTPELAAELSSLIGTTTEYDDVRDAMTQEFDSHYYLAMNGDVRAVTDDGRRHYLLHGWSEGRNPSQFFDHAFYRSTAPRLGNREFPLAHFVKIGKPSGALANPIGNRRWFEPMAPIATQWALLTPATMKENTEAVVIIPVYKGFDETMMAIFQAVASRGNDNYCVLVVNDKSPDDAINEQLRVLAGQGLFEYHSSVINRGFVQTCNYAIQELSRNLDVVLLNSDAYVFPGWFSRLQAHARKPNVATVTALSNNATICSYPLVNHDNFLALECSPQQLDEMAANVNQGLSVETPTGVGFCFYMNRAVINKIGILDADAFKVGYGEENDFCMRALNKGYKNLIAGDVFAFHIGSVSFSATKEENVRKGQSALEMKHPNYPSLVAKHALADPERRLRRFLDLERIGKSLSGATIFVTHNWGGGISTYLEREREKCKRNKIPYVTLVVHDRHRVTINTNYALFVPNLTDIDLRCEFNLLTKLVEKIKPRNFHINSFAGIEWHWQRKLLEFIQETGIRYQYVCHDYSSISHQYNLLRPDFIYDADCTIEERRLWSTMVERDAIDVCDPDERLAVYKQFLENAATVEAPSKAACQILEREFPSVVFRTVPHGDHLPDVHAAERRNKDKRIRVATVGAIGPHKGSDVILALAIDAKNRNLELDYSVIGFTDIDVALKENGVSVTGKYLGDEHAIQLIREIEPDVIFIPSICAETYCFALSMALKLKIPPIVFNIGAQAERVLPLPWGKAFPIELAYNPRRLSEEILRLDLDMMWAKRHGEVRTEEAA